ncbi:PD-(D/E)XK motif protein [Brevibacterium sp. BDJS002]|uniref:PD-(D/E)XK motif protein n=1 Tax=Brevibacterium sp. BDJS002 TaxID=3020906 RepID=UPI0023079F80|nr:PD-(D/E)XK motif protein [Brevibacterium sp. BDJS002]WCE40421.1 PD-(D/E)XK motif protein [Brevibacterium sp. BDJS002]
MRIDSVLSEALDYGQVLGEHEARVAPVPGLEVGSRVWIGTDNEDRHVAYFEVAGERFNAFAVSEVLEVSWVATAVGDESDLQTAKVICRDGRLNDVFLSLIEDVVSQLGEGDSLDVLLGSVAAWRRLLQIVDNGLPEAAAAGLYGELLFLEILVENCGPQQVNIWQISENDVHDFIGTEVRAEVKTSSFQNQQSVTVHGLKQLDAVSGADLFLAVAEIQRHGNGETIDDVVSRLLDRGVDIDALSKKLEARGFVRGMSSATALEKTFDLQSWRFWPITSASPVISASSLGAATTTAVADVSYSLNLSSLGEAMSSLDWNRFSL